jgi:hypothetical protein
MLPLFTEHLQDHQPEPSVEAKMRRLQRLLVRAVSATGASRARRTTSSVLLSLLAELINSLY